MELFLTCACFVLSVGGLIFLPIRLCAKKKGPILLGSFTTEPGPVAWNESLRSTRRPNGPPPRDPPPRCSKGCCTP